MKKATIGEAMTAVMTLYPRIYFACHTRHVRDPQSQRLLSRHQASILDHLDELEPTTVMALAGHMGVTPATMSIAVDRLERKGYVVRLKDAKDRRRVHVRLTTAGVRVRDASSVLDRRASKRWSDVCRTRSARTPSKASASSRTRGRRCRTNSGERRGIPPDGTGDR